MWSHPQKIDTKLWYSQPAKQWNQALPVGNGRLGAMIFGQVQKERIQLNEDSVWSGTERLRINPDASTYVEQIKEQLRNGSVHKAERLAKYALCAVPRPMNAYQTLGDLFISFHYPGNQSVYSLKDDAADYSRELELNTAVSGVRFRVGGNLFTRQIFCSAPDDVLVVHIESHDGVKFSLDAEFARRPFEMKMAAGDDDTIEMSGVCSPGGIEYCAAVKAVADGGKVSFIGQSLIVQDVSRCTLLVAAYTSYRYADPRAKCLKTLEKAANKPYQSLKNAHIDDYRGLFGRMELDLGCDEELINLPTDIRLQRIRGGLQDRGMAGLIFDLAGYLLISSSRRGTLAANLQGIWNSEYTPAWESKYTININIQMNYWAAEARGLGDCHLALLDFMEKVRENGEITAKKMYGCRGFCAHNNLDIWADTAPVTDAPLIACWTAGGAWLSLHFWEHYKYGLDIDYLRQKGWPVMKAACLFLLDFMEPDEEGYLVTPISSSPENLYYADDGQTAGICRGAAMDIQIVNELFAASIEACGILECDYDLREKLIAAKGKLRPVRISENGSIMEWPKDFKSTEPGHRHISHLFALYPGTYINTAGDADMAKAAQRALEDRLNASGGHTGWAAAWISCCYARLNNAANAYKNLMALYQPFSMTDNLFCVFPANEGRLVFQIDANFGAAAAIIEMLLQSHTDIIHLLPALPAQWPDGQVKGLRARGGFVFDMRWEKGRLAQAVMRCAKGGKVRLRCGGSDVLELDVCEGGQVVLTKRDFEKEQA